MQLFNCKSLRSASYLTIFTCELSHVAFYFPMKTKEVYFNPLTILTHLNVREEIHCFVKIQNFIKPIF